MTGYVYAIKCADRVKIGYSERPRQRIYNINSYSPYPCKLLGFIEGPVETEKELHKRFADFNSHGEWFCFVGPVKIWAETLGFADTIEVREEDLPIDHSSATLLEKCIEKAGGITALAKSLKITHQAIYSWKKIPSERVVDVEKVTGISRQILRPDLYDGMPSQEPAE